MYLFAVERYLFYPTSQFSSVPQSCPTLWPHGLQRARLPCPPEAYSNTCLLSQWCHSTISFSVVPFSCLQSFPASGSFSNELVLRWSYKSVVSRYRLVQNENDFVELPFWLSGRNYPSLFFCCLVVLFFGFFLVLKCPFYEIIVIFKKIKALTWQSKRAKMLFRSPHFFLIILLNVWKLKLLKASSGVTLKNLK